jgi:hypothetical protein
MNYPTSKFEADAIAFADRRGSPRRKTRFKATIVHGPQRDTLECTVRDLSETGARLRVDAPDALPAVFHLVWSADRAVLEVESVWRSGTETGVKFLSKHDMQGRLSSELAAVCRAFEQRGRVKS